MKVPQKGNGYAHKRKRGCYGDRKEIAKNKEKDKDQDQDQYQNEHKDKLKDKVKTKDKVKGKDIDLVMCLLETSTGKQW